MVVLEHQQANHNLIRKHWGKFEFSTIRSYSGQGQIVGGWWWHTAQELVAVEASGGLNFTGLQDNHALVQGEHRSGNAGRGGTSGHRSSQYVEDNGNTTPNAQNGQSGNAGFVYIFEYIGT